MGFLVRILFLFIKNERVLLVFYVNIIKKLTLKRFLKKLK
jgi:hypothetical protein